MKNHFNKFQRRQKGVSTLVGIIIIVAVAVVSVGGIFAYQYFAAKSQQGQNQEIANKDIIGNYSYDEYAPPDEGWVYDLEMYQEGNQLKAKLNIDGFQTLTRILADVVKNNDNLNIIFNSYGPDNMYSSFKTGDRIFSLEKTSDSSYKILWDKMQPQVPADLSSNNEFKKETNQTAGWTTYNFTGYWGDKCNVKYPGAWELKHDNFINFDYLAPEIKNVPEDIWVTINCFPKSKGYIDQAGKDLIAFCKKGKMSLSQTEKFEAINSREFCILSDDGSQIGTMQFQVRYGRQKMDYYISDAEIKSELDAFNQILPTFKFTNPSIQ